MSAWDDASRDHGERGQDIEARAEQARRMVDERQDMMHKARVARNALRELLNCGQFVLTTSLDRLDRLNHARADLEAFTDDIPSGS